MYYVQPVLVFFFLFLLLYTLVNVYSQSKLGGQLTIGDSMVRNSECAPDSVQQ